MKKNFKIASLLKTTLASALCCAGIAAFAEVEVADAAQPAQNAEASLPPPIQTVLPLSLDPVFASHYAHALETHPAIAAAKARETAALRKAGALDISFKTPILSASAGYAGGPDDMPGISLTRAAAQDSISFAAGVEAPVAKGIYAGAGAAQRFLTDSPDADAQTALGVRLRIPLMKDFKHALNEGEVSKLRAEALVAAAESAKIRATLSRDIFLAWNIALRSAADADAVARAEQRAEKLLEETSERARFQDVAGYQVFPAQYEVALRKEELLDARQSTIARLETLKEHLGLSSATGAVIVSRSATNAVFTAANAVILHRDLAFSAADTLSASPAYLSAIAKLAASKAALQTIVEGAKDSLDFSAGAGFRGETDSGVIGTDDIITQNTAIFEIGITYRRSLGRSGADAEIAATKAEVEACEADVAATKNEVLAALARAQTGFAGACARLSLALEAIERASAALSAEESRFNLGEGTSRNVLDAQKDLTNATRRGISVAGSVVDSFVELLYSAGIDPQQAFCGE